MELSDCSEYEYETPKRKKTTFLELNFGPSEFSLRDPPDEYDPDMILKIPIDGSLSPLPNLKKLEKAKSRVDSLKPLKTDRNFPAVTFPIDNFDNWTYNHDIIMLWIEERKEWVAIRYERWREDGSRNDEDYDGPFALDDYCSSMLAQVYGIPEDTENIRKLEPSRLESISREGT